MIGWRRGKGERSKRKWRKRSMRRELTSDEVAAAHCQRRPRVGRGQLGLGKWKEKEKGLGGEKRKEKGGGQTVVLAGCGADSGRVIGGSDVKGGGWSVEWGSGGGNGRVSV